MLSNSDIADALKLYANLSELHGGNDFKIKSYNTASFKLDKFQDSLEGKSAADIEKMVGIAKSPAGKVEELIRTETFAELQELLDKTPQGVRGMFRVKGIGPKKIAYIWNVLGIESIGELLYACNENRLAQAKGFGQKTQQAVKESIEFIYANANKFNYAKVEKLAFDLVTALQQNESTHNVSLTGAIRRKCEIIDELEICVSLDGDEQEFAGWISETLNVTNLDLEGSIIKFNIQDTIPVIIHVCDEQDFAYTLFETTASTKHIEKLKLINATPVASNFENEEAIYASVGLQYIEPEMREGSNEVSLAQQNTLPKLIKLSDLKGILHNHTTYSDGANTLAEMASYCKELGYEYLGICDHSKAAQYAGGLSEEEIIKQHAEIDVLNQQAAAFKVFKGIECDILGDGSLDYNNEILASFDFVVASIHSNLKMNEEKAMSRLLKAIENPYTTMLGHPTGRLLLMREGYPINHQKMIDACAANGVVIEINANPYRLDLDWRWIDYALQKGVMLSINPDAHELQGYHDMYFGVQVARKGGLFKEMCFNAKSLTEIQEYFIKRKP